TVAPPTTAVEVMVQAAGAVVAPGVYRLPLGARVQDVITAAGGPTGAANLQAVPLASNVVDGQRVYVPALGEVAGAVPAPPRPTPRSQSGHARRARGPSRRGPHHGPSHHRLPKSSRPAVVGRRPPGGPRHRAGQARRLPRPRHRRVTRWCRPSRTRHVLARIP